MLTACNRSDSRDPSVAIPGPADGFSVASHAAPADVSLDVLLAYLHQEFGETPADPDALQAKDLTFFGTLQFTDRTEHVWRFPCSATTGCWLRVTQRASGRMIGWSVDAPPEV